MLRKSFTTIALVVLVLSLIATSGPIGTRAQGKTYKIALSVPSMNAFWVFMVKQMQDEAKKLGDVTLDVMDAATSTGKQNADLTVVVSDKYDGLILSPLDAKWVESAVKKVSDASIPVIAVSDDINDSAKLTLAFVGPDNVLGGREQGWYIMQSFPKGATIFNVTGYLPMSSASDRLKGLHEVLDPRPEYKIAAEQTGNFMRDDAMSITRIMLSSQATPPDVINTANDDMALGVIEVLRAKNLNGKVAVLGFDAISNSLQAILNGDQTATVDGNPGAQSSTALDILESYLSKGTRPAQHDIYLPPVLIDKHNLPCAAFYGDLLTAVATQAAGASQPAMPALDKSLCVPLTAPAGSAPAATAAK